MHYKIFDHLHLLFDFQYVSKIYNYLMPLLYLSNF